jgi:hypothetical protein
MAMVHSGIILGWSHLPQDIQRRVEWVGAAFLADTQNLSIEVEVKLNFEINIYCDQAFLKPTAVFMVKSKTDAGVASEFRELVLKMIKDASKKIEERSVSIAALLN